MRPDELRGSNLPEVTRFEILLAPSEGRRGYNWSVPTVLKRLNGHESTGSRRVKRSDMKVL